MKNNLDNQVQRYKFIRITHKQILIEYYIKLLIFMRTEVALLLCVDSEDTFRMDNPQIYEIVASGETVGMRNNSYNMDVV